MHLNRVLELILLKLDRLEDRMNAVNQGLLDLQKAVANETTLDAQIVAAFKSLQDQIAALQAQNTEVTDAQLEQLAQTLGGAQATLTALIPPPAPPAAPAAPATSSVSASPLVGDAHVLNTTGEGVGPVVEGPAVQGHMPDAPAPVLDHAGATNAPAAASPQPGKVAGS